MIRRLVLLAALGSGCAQIIGFADEHELHLANLEVSTGTLVPAFDPEVTTYTLGLPYLAANLEVTASASEAVDLSITGASAVTDVPYPLAVPVGDTTISIALQTSSGVTRTYTVSTHRADLDVSFSAAQSVFGFGMMYDVQGTDVDGDGVDDLLYASFDGRVGTLVNDGHGVFTSAAWLPPVNPRTMEIADVTGDGLADLIVSNGSLLVASGNGDGTSEDAMTFGQFEDVGAFAIGAVDDDALDDLVLANGAGLVTPLFGRATGLEQGPDWSIAPYIGEPRIVRLAQMNGAKLVALDSSARTITITTMTEPMVRTPFQLDGQSFPSDMVVADFDSDGSDDIAVLDAFANTVIVLTRFPNWARTTISIAGYPRSLAVGDLDADGRPDLAMTAGNDLVVLRNDGTANFEQRRFTSMADTPSHLAIGDFDHDGRDDVIFATGTSEMMMYFGVHRE